MNLTEFFTLILPDEGYRIVAKHQKYMKQFGVKTNADAAKLAKEIDQALPRTAGPQACFFACATYKTKDDRTAANALAVKSLWRDLDVGENKQYQSLEDAIAATLDFCTQTKLPMPLMVSSGGGCHVYWPFTASVTPDEWRTMAGNFRALCKKQKFASDPTRDKDITSLLRPPGTHNLKLDTPRKVRIITEAEPTDPEDLIDIIAAALGRSTQDEPKALEALPAYLKDTSGDTQSVIDLVAYPPSDAKAIARNCSQIAHFRDTGSESYQHWWLSIMTVKRCIDGEKICHDWSKKSDDYSDSECQQKIDDAQGVGTCELFDDMDGRCKKCEYRGQITSPIQLGITEAIADTITAPEEVEDAAVFNSLPDGYSLRDGKIVARKKDKNGVVDFQPVANVKFTFTDRYQTPDGTMAYNTVMEVRKEKGGGQELREFATPAKLIGKGGAELLGHLAQFEILPAPGGKNYMDYYTMALANQIRERRAATKSYASFGWHENRTVFLLGDTLFTPEGEQRVVLANHNVKRMVDAFHSPEGADPDGWCDAIHSMYLHDRHEQFWFVLYSIFGSILTQMLNHNVGLPINLEGTQGLGKTGVALAGLTAWGNERHIGAVWQGTTENAFFDKLGLLNSLPTLLDETTNINGETASRMCYSISSGQDKERLNSAAQRSVCNTFGNTVIMTSNESLTEKLTANKQNATAEISRLIEIPWQDVQTIPRAEFDPLMETARAHAGAMGKQFVRWIMHNGNQKKTIKLFTDIRAEVETQLSIDKEYRFWSLGLAQPLTAGYILSNLMGSFKFPWENVLNYSLRLGRDHVGKVGSQTADGWEMFNRVVNFYSSQTIVTNTMKDGRSQIVPDVVTISGEPVARIVRDTGDLYISINAVRSWCEKNHGSYKEIRRKLRERGMERGDRETRIYLGRGTNKSTGQTYCMHINWDKFQELAPSTASVHELRTVA